MEVVADGDQPTMHEEGLDSLKPCIASRRGPDHGPTGLGKKSERFSSFEEESSSCTGLPRL